MSPVASTGASPAASSVLLRHPEQLAALLGIPFTDEQLAAITAPLEPGVIVAGAGSGKTTVMAARVVWLVGTGAVAPERVLGLTFTNKAAAELASRVRAVLVKAGVLDPDWAGGGVVHEPAGAVAGESTISTYHAFAGRLLTEHGMRIGVEPSSRLLADAGRYQLAALAIRDAPGPYPALTGPISSLVAEVIALDGELNEHLVSTAALRAHDRELIARVEAMPRTHVPVRDAAAVARRRIELSLLVDEYRTAKLRRDLIDFGDQIAFTARLAEEHPEVSLIERERFGVVLLDEYQDTSVAQRRLLAALFGPPHGAGHPVTAVGDPCQAIYGWRGASVANLDEFPEHFPRVDGAQRLAAARYALSENRRSGGALLDFANTLAAPLRAMHAGVDPLRPAPGAEGEGRVRCALSATYAEETAWVASRIHDLVDTGTPADRIAVLVRLGADLPVLSAALAEHGVPVEVVGLSGLLYLPEVAELVSMLEALDDPTANAALVRLLAGPRWRIGPRDLALLGRRARELVRMPQRAGNGTAGDSDNAGSALERAVAEMDPTEVVSLADALADPGATLPFSPAARRRFAAFASELRVLRRHLADPLLDLIHRVITVSGLDVELAAQSPGPQASPQTRPARRRDNLGAFLDVAAGFADVDGDVSLTAFLAFLRAAEDYDRGMDHTAPTGSESVKLLTAHKAKGLEWDVVVVPRLSQGVFPSAQAREQWTRRHHVLPHDLRGDAAGLPGVAGWTAAGLRGFAADMAAHARIEELRLGYVAVTRPRTLLIASGHWWGPVQKRPRGPSQFLEQLREHCVSGHGTVDEWADPPVPDAVNPAIGQEREQPWPLPPDPDRLAARHHGADLVRAALADLVALAENAEGSVHPQHRGDAAGSGDGDALRPDPLPVVGALDPAERRLVASWDRDLTALLEEARRAGGAAGSDIPLPVSLHVSQLVRLAVHPEDLARELARPMPRPPAPPQARGMRFHAWVESLFGVPALLEVADLPGAEADPQEPDGADLRELQEGFRRTPYATRPPYRLGVPFRIVLAGRVIRGRIDAVYRAEDGYEVFAWRTAGPDGRGAAGPADAVRLAVYRLAWAELAGTSPGRVDAVLLHVRTGLVVRPNLPGRTDLERLLTASTDGMFGSGSESAEGVAEDDRDDDPEAFG